MRNSRVRAFAARHAAELIADSLPAPADFHGEGFTAEDRVAVYNELKQMAQQLLAKAEELEALR